MSKDSKTVSNEYHEVEQIAKTLEVEPWVIYMAKAWTNSNSREVIKDWVSQYKDSTIKVKI